MADIDDQREALYAIQQGLTRSRTTVAPKTRRKTTVRAERVPPTPPPLGPDLPFSDEFFEAWHVLRAAIDRILTAQPAQMSEAADRLEKARRNYEKVLFSELRKT